MSKAVFYNFQYTQESIIKLTLYKTTLGIPNKLGEEMLKLVKEISSINLEKNSTMDSTL